MSETEIIDSCKSSYFTSSVKISIWHRSILHWELSSRLVDESNHRESSSHVKLTDPFQLHELVRVSGWVGRVGFMDLASSVEPALECHFRLVVFILSLNIKSELNNFLGAKNTSFLWSMFLTMWTGKSHRDPSHDFTLLRLSGCGSMSTTGTLDPQILPSIVLEHMLSSWSS